MKLISYFQNRPILFPINIQTSACFMDTHLIQKPNNYGHFALSLLNLDIPLIWTLSMAPFNSAHIKKVLTASHFHEYQWANMLE